MSLLTSSVDVGGILPDDYASLITNPLRQASVALTAATVITTNSHTVHVPVLTGDVAAAWTAEGAEIAEDDAVFDEVDVTPSKLASLSVISRELAEDSSPEASAIIGQSMAANLARKIDSAFFGSTVTNGPSGIGSLTAAGTTATPTGGFVNLDEFVSASMKAYTAGSSVTAWVASPDDAEALFNLKTGTAYNQPLLGVDATQPHVRLIGGVPLLVSPDVTAGTVYGIPKAHALVVMRDNVRLEVSRDAKFTSDQVVVKCTLRAGFAFPNPAAVQKITVTA